MGCRGKGRSSIQNSDRSARGSTNRDSVRHNTVRGPFEVRFDALEKEEQNSPQELPIRKGYGRPKSLTSFDTNGLPHSQGFLRSNDRSLPNSAPIRRYDCENYQCCLELAAALDWESFTCVGCCGEINDTLVWNAHLAQRGDKVAEKICDLPKIPCLHSTSTHDKSAEPTTEAGESTADSEQPAAANESPFRTKR